jgi:glycosyltransferase involved in cell wall biosynthesis
MKNDKKIVLLIENYPSPENLYSAVFAHVRVKKYIELSYDVLVITNFTENKSDYVYEGVKVVSSGKYENIVNIIDHFSPDIVLIHFLSINLMNHVVKIRKYSYLVWIHGYEAMGWYRRLYNLEFSLNYVNSTIRSNIAQLWSLRKIIKASNSSKINLRFVFVSNWIKKITETDCCIKVHKSYVISNPIDNEVFSAHSKKGIEKNILIIRPFDRKKYATDLMIETIKILSKKKGFDELKFTVFGKGSDTSNLKKMSLVYPNIIVENSFLSHEQIAELHRTHAVFFALTRQDTQGVSACEAMSSGLVVVTSNNSAVPEFIKHRKTGLLTNNKPLDVAEQIEWLIDNPEIAEEISNAASDFIDKKLSTNEIITKEVEVIDKMIAES